MLEPLPCEGARPLPEDASLVDDSGDSVSSEAEYSDEYLDALGDEGEGVAAAWEPLSSFVPAPVATPERTRTPKPVVALYRDVIKANAVQPAPREATLDMFGPAAVDHRLEGW